MAADGVLHCIEIEEKKFYIYSTFNDVELHTHLTDGLVSYNGKLDAQQQEELSSLVDMDMENYTSLLRQAFGFVKTDNKFFYTLSKENMKFSWKQGLDNGIKFQLGSIVLQNDKSSNVSNILDVVAKQLEQLKNRVDLLEESKKIVEKEYKTAVKRMGACSDTKRKVEQELFSKFCVVLNSKKAKIRELKTQLKKSQTAPVATTQERPEEEDDDDREDETTDEEKEKDTNVEVKESDEEERADIILDEKITEDDDKPRKNRRRVRTSRPKTPSNVNVPRTTSLPRPKQQNSAGSESSGKKKKLRTEEVDADDLLDML